MKNSSCESNSATQQHSVFWGTGLLLAVATCVCMFPKSSLVTQHRDHRLRTNSSKPMVHKNDNNAISTNEPYFSTASYLYVGSLDHNASSTGLPAMSKTHLIDEDFRFWVAGGIVATDIAIVNVEGWNSTTAGATSGGEGGWLGTSGKLTIPGSSDAAVSIRLALSTLLKRVQLLEDQARKQETRIAALTAGCLGIVKASD